MWQLINLKLAHTYPLLDLRPPGYANILGPVPFTSNRCRLPSLGRPSI